MEDGCSMNYPMNNYQNFGPVNPADQNPPCNTLYVGNLPIDTSEEELKAIFQKQRGYKRLSFRTKQNGPVCFVEFEDISQATRALHECYGIPLHNSVKGGIRLSFSKNPLGVSGLDAAEAEAKLAAARRAVEEAEWRKKLEEEAKLKAEIEARRKIEDEKAKNPVVSRFDYSGFDALDHPPRGDSRRLRFLRRSSKNTTVFRHLKHVTISRDNTADDNLRRSASFAYLGSKLAVCYETSLKSKSDQATLPTQTENKIQVTSQEETYLCTYKGCERSIPGKGFPRQWNLRDHLRRVHNDAGIELSKSNNANQLHNSSLYSSLFSESFIDDNSNAQHPDLNSSPIRVPLVPLKLIDRARRRDEEVRAEERKIALEKAKKEIEDARREAEKAAREAIEAERKAEAERIKREAEAVARAEKDAREKLEAERKADEPRERRKHSLASNEMRVTDLRLSAKQKPNEPRSAISSIAPPSRPLAPRPQSDWRIRKRT
ncbi:hypothetical protein F4679DRAFT_87401 [Xylaria curta]|nr:hypothetical protein F4679DRAFT_87401 [Xylaria curta]